MSRSVFLKSNVSMFFGGWEGRKGRRCFFVSCPQNFLPPSLLPSIKILKTFTYCFLQKLYTFSPHFWVLLNSLFSSGSLQILSIPLISWLCHTACRILMPGPGIESMLPAAKAQSLNTGPQGKSQFVDCCKFSKCTIMSSI